MMAAQKSPADNLSDTDLDDLSEMYVRIFPASLLSNLGKGYLRTYHRFVDESDREEIIIIRGDEKIIGCAVLSLSSSTLLRRLIVHNPPVIDVIRLLLSFRFGGIASVLSKIFFKSSQRTEKETVNVELISLFTDPSRRGQGVGASLVEKCNALLKEKGIERYFVKTRDTPDNRAMDFYLRNGFKVTGAVEWTGKKYAVLEMTIPSAP